MLQCQKSAATIRVKTMANVSTLRLASDATALLGLWDVTAKRVSSRHHYKSVRKPEHRLLIRSNASVLLAVSNLGLGKMSDAH